MWKSRGKSLFSSVKKFKHSVMIKINHEVKETITVTLFDIFYAFKDIKCNKSCGVDNIYHGCIHFLLSYLFFAFLFH